MSLSENETSPQDRERNHVRQFADWIETAMRCIEKADYEACRHALGIARMYLDRAQTGDVR